MLLAVEMNLPFPIRVLPTTRSTAGSGEFVCGSILREYEGVKRKAGGMKSLIQKSERKRLGNPEQGESEKRSVRCLSDATLYVKTTSIEKLRADDSEI